MRHPLASSETSFKTCLIVARGSSCGNTCDECGPLSHFTTPAPPTSLSKAAWSSFGASAARALFHAA